MNNFKERLRNAFDLVEKYNLYQINNEIYFRNFEVNKLVFEKGNYIYSDIRVTIKSNKYEDKNYVIFDGNKFNCKLMNRKKPMEIFILKSITEIESAVKNKAKGEEEYSGDCSNKSRFLDDEFNELIKSVLTEI